MSTTSQVKRKEERFVDPTYGFGFSYPADWTVEKGAAVVLTPINQRGRQGCEVTVDRLAPEEFADLYGPVDFAAGAREVAKVYAARVRAEVRSGRVMDLDCSTPRPRKCGPMEGFQVVLSYNNRARKLSTLSEYSRAAFQRKRVIFATDGRFAYRLEYHCQGPAGLADKHSDVFRMVLRTFRVE